MNFNSIEIQHNGDILEITTQKIITITYEWDVIFFKNHCVFSENSRLSSYEISTVLHLTFTKYNLQLSQTYNQILLNLSVKYTKL